MPELPNDTFSTVNTRNRMIMYKSLLNMLEEAVVAPSKLVSKRLFQGIKRNHESPQS
jgi:hypothetical protein